MPSDPAPMLTRELAPGEAVRWCGRPRMRAALLSPDAWLFPLVWTTSGIGWFALTLSLTTGPRSLAAVARLETGSVLPFVGVVVILGGVVSWIGAVVVALRTRHTLHAITDRRLLGIECGRRVRVRMVPLRRIESVIGARSARDRGTIRVSATTIQDGRPVKSGAFVLRGVPDAARARALLDRGGFVSLQV